MEKQDVRIIVLPSGFVFIGVYKRTGNTILLSSASNIRRYGTTKGLGELIYKPTSETVLDPCGFVETDKSQVLFSIRCGQAWVDTYLNHKHGADL